MCCAGVEKILWIDMWETIYLSMSVMDNVCRASRLGHTLAEHYGSDRQSMAVLKNQEHC
jgi:hypothetical protein